MLPSPGKRLNNEFFWVKDVAYSGGYEGHTGTWCLRLLVAENEHRCGSGQETAPFSQSVDSQKVKSCRQNEQKANPQLFP